MSMEQKTKGYSKYAVCIILLTVLFLFSEFYFILSSVDVKNYKDSLSMYERAGFEDGLYFSASGGGTDPYGEPDIEKLKGLPAVEDVVYLNYTHFYVPTGKDTQYYNVLIFPDSAIHAFPLPVSEGVWMSDFPAISENNGALNALVCGDPFRNVKVDGTIDAFEVGSDEPAKIKVLGKLPEGVVLPHFGGFGGENSTDQLFEVGNLSSNYILMREQDFVRFQDFHPQFSGLACVIRLKSDVGKDEVAKTTDKLFQMGRYCRFEEILAQGKKNLQSLLKSQIVIPAAFLIVCALSYFVLILTFSEGKDDTVLRKKSKLKRAKIWALSPPLFSAFHSLIFSFRVISFVTDYTLFILFEDTKKQVWPFATSLLLGYSVICLMFAILTLYGIPSKKDRKPSKKNM